jgi:pyruvate,water dikinase
MPDRPLSFIRWFSDLGLDDVPAVGGKNASLGELYRELAGAGVRVPNGFAISRRTSTPALPEGSDSSHMRRTR